jgi:hypothetical protein
MIRYLRENGFPVDLVLESEFTDGFDYPWTTHVSVNGRHLVDFEHIHENDRKFWADGFLAGLEWEE